MGCIYSFMPYFIGGLVKPPMKLRYVWVITSPEHNGYDYVSMFWFQSLAVKETESFDLLNIDPNANGGRSFV